MATNWSERSRSVTLGLLRIVTGLLFLQHGAQKVFGMFGGFGEPGATAELASLMGLAGVLELLGGALILLGLLTRPVAFVLAGEMAIAYFLRHAPEALWPLENRGEPAVLFCFAFLLFAAHGAGAFSLDAALRRPRRRAGFGLGVPAPTR